MAAVVIMALLPGLIGVQPAAAGIVILPPIGGTAFESELLAKARPDECFNGIGRPYPPGPPCAEGQPKVNQAYVWSLAEANRRLWFGTGANVNCIVQGSTLQLPTPRINDDYVCEFAQSQIVVQNPTMPKNVGDHRQPHIYYYDLDAKALTEKTDDVKNFSSDDAYRLKTTLGLRAGGTANGVVLLAGPALGVSINMFAFDTTTGQYLGSANFTKYGNIRHFLVADGVLYAGVGVGQNGKNGGYLLRWTGDKTNPFAFTEVGKLPAQVADLTVHDGRIFVSTWSAVAGGALAASEMAPPSGTSTGGSSATALLDGLGSATSSLLRPGPKTLGEANPALAGVWMSPKLANGEPGLTASDLNLWTEVWATEMYEPDPIIASTYGLGALASYGGYLYWGTMHVPMKATSVFAASYPPPDEVTARETLNNTQRAVSIFRGRGFGGLLPTTEVLYGESQLPAYDPTANGGAGAWEMTSTGYLPRFGHIGFGNIYTNYTWTMAVVNDRLFVGCMDWSYLAKDLLPKTAEALGFANAATGSELDPITIDPALYGGDLYMFDSILTEAKAVDTKGLGNYMNYGFRTMVPDGKTLYLGMANPMNLRTDPTDDKPEGGWELIRLTQK